MAPCYFVCRTTKEEEENQRVKFLSATVACGGVKVAVPLYSCYPLDKSIRKVTKWHMD